MAKLKIGEGIQLEAKFPDEKPSRLDKVSDRVYQTQEDALDCIKRTEELNKKIKELGINVDVLEEKIDNNQNDILSVMNSVNAINSRPMEIIKNPEIKQVTFHRDHTKDFEELYQEKNLDKKELESKIMRKIDKVELNKQINKQKKINLILGIATLLSLVAHLF